MTTSSTLAELATRHPGASRVFQRFGLDYCCGGRQALADACARKGLDADALLEAIADEEACVDLPRWDRAPLPELIHFIIERYHRTLRAELPALISYAARVEQRHGDKPGCPVGLRDLLETMHQSVVEHLEKEERLLFPMILDGQGQLAGGPVRVLEEEHDEHGMHLECIRALTNNLTPPPGACPTWRALYLRLGALEAELMDHVHLENHVLFPRALRGEGAAS